MSTAVATALDLTPEERALLTGDLSKLSADQRATLIGSVCRSVGLNPLTQPFSYITLNGKLTLYAKKDATDQIRALRNVSLRIDSKEQIGDLFVVCVSAMLPSGRTDSEIGAVNVKGLGGEALANAMMKAITKAKRRATLSICGLGFLDETEVDAIPGAQMWQEPRQQQSYRPLPSTQEVPRQITRTVDIATGEVLQESPEAREHVEHDDYPVSKDRYDKLCSLVASINAYGKQEPPPDPQMKTGEAKLLWKDLKAILTDLEQQAKERAL